LAGKRACSCAKAPEVFAALLCAASFVKKVDEIMVAIFPLLFRVRFMKLHNPETQISKHKIQKVVLDFEP
jgi:hypothetical protein